MGAGFQHDIAGGSGVLIAAQIQSPNFSVPGGAGWAILKDGTAYFYDVILPGGTGGATVTFASTAPASPSAGDLWYNTAAGLVVSQWNGSAWVAYQYGGGAIASQSITSGLLAAGAIDGYTVNAITINSGTVSASDIIVSGTSGGAFAYSSGGLIVDVFTSSGSWTIPAGVTSYELEEWAAGGGGGGYNSADDAGGGGGGGEYVRYNSRSGTPGATINFTIGAPGIGGGSSSNGTNGGNTVWDTSGAPLTAHGGQGGHYSFGLGGDGGTGNTTADAHYDGGQGGDSDPVGVYLGGGGGGSAGSSSAGIHPANGDSTGAPAVADGGPGGYAEQAPVTGPGGGGGGANGDLNPGGGGWGGQIRITYTSTSPQLIASIAGAATTDPVASASVPEGIAADHVSVTTASAPATPSGRVVLYYEGGTLYAVGPSGTPVAIATT